MRLFSGAVRLWRGVRAVVKALPQLSSVDSRGGWWPIVRESFAGAWQQNTEVSIANVLTYAAVYACVTLIASDIGKLRVKLVAQDADGIWTETDNPAFSPVLRKPNRYQIRIKFFEQWMTSKLIHGNTYVLKQRDRRGIVTALYVLDPQRVKPLVAPDGAVYYELKRDDLSGLPEDNPAVPASEIIHDVCVALYHPLVGISPISACGLAAVQGLRIQDNSATFFGNGSKPGGVLTAPGFIKDETAARLKKYWEENFSGDNVGKVAVLGDGLKYEQMAMSAVDAQLIEQLKWSAENVCTAFHVPAYMVGIGPPPNYSNIEALNQQYYSQCLQEKIETIELLLDDGLGLATDTGLQRLGTECDLDDLLLMDTATRVKAAADSIGCGAVSPDEARKRFFGLGKVPGGASPYLQQQNFSLAALAKRDASADPFRVTSPQTPDQGRRMTTADLAGLVRGIAPAVKEYVAQAVGSMADRLNAIEQRLASVRDGQDGAAGTPGEPGAAGQTGERGLTGADGIPGRDGRDGMPAAAGEKGQNGTDGRDGVDGTDGVDGLGFDDVTAQMTGDRTLTISFVKGGQVKAFPLVLSGLVLYRGVYSEGWAYEAGDSVTFGGSQWIAKEATTAKPGGSDQAARSWQLAVKVGRDGKVGAPGSPGLPGPRGEKGDDGRHGGAW